MAKPRKRGGAKRGAPKKKSGARSQRAPLSRAKPGKAKGSKPKVAQKKTREPKNRRAPSKKSPQQKAAETRKRNAEFRKRSEAARKGWLTRRLKAVKRQRQRERAKPKRALKLKVLSNGQEVCIATVDVSHVPFGMWTGEQYAQELGALFGQLDKECPDAKTWASGFAALISTETDDDGEPIWDDGEHHFSVGYDSGPFRLKGEEKRKAGRTRSQRNGASFIRFYADGEPHAPKDTSKFVHFYRMHIQRIWARAIRGKGRARAKKEENKR